MFRSLRTLATFAIVGGLIWAAFAVKLGPKTFAEHIDSIGETHEAKALLDGTRSTVNPALDDAKERVLGEYVEAPTYLPSGAETVDAKPPAPARDAIPTRAAARWKPNDGREDSGPDVSTGDRTKLPGRR